MDRQARPVIYKNIIINIIYTVQRRDLLCWYIRTIYIYFFFIKERCIRETTAIFFPRTRMDGRDISARTKNVFYIYFKAAEQNDIKKKETAKEIYAASDRIKEKV